jgi:hypothetical protein
MATSTITKETANDLSMGDLLSESLGTKVVRGWQVLSFEKSVGRAEVCQGIG